VQLSDVPIAFGLGDTSSCAVLKNGTVECWGEGYGDQLGSGSDSDATRPVSIPSLSDVTAISVRATHSCVLHADRSVACWSLQWLGSFPPGLGLSVTPPPPGSGTPSLVAKLGDVTSIATGETHACALIADGTVKCWGANGSGQLGNPDPSDSSEPVTVSNLRDVTAIAAGSRSTCAVVKDGTVHCWGSSDAGELGDGITANSAYPVTVSNLNDATAIAAGGYHYCVVTRSHAVRCWGAGMDKQLGNGANRNSNVPVVVQFPR
jgi:alpha-tubulin suppressor-like RCC1 family protein